MSVPRVLLAPTHRTGLAAAVAAGVAEVVGRQERHVRFHHLGALCPGAAWDRWEGASFLDLSLYDPDTLAELYESTTRGAQLSLLASSTGVLDACGAGSWTAVDVARILDCPLVLVVDCRGWGAGLAALVDGFNERLVGLNLAGVILTGVRDREHREQLRQVLSGGRPPVVGCLYAEDGPGWDSFAPGPWGLPLDPQVVESIHRQVDTAGLEHLAGQRGFLAGAARAVERGPQEPLVVVAGGRGFTPWSRDSIEALRAGGARVRRVDLLEDRCLPDDAAGLVLAGHLWVDMLPALARNYSLMRELRVRIGDGLPTLALGGGMLYLMRRLQDPLGRSFDLAGALPAEGELLGDLETPEYLEVRAERDSVLLAEGERLAGWITADAEIIEAPVSRGFPLSVSGSGWPKPKLEGAATTSLLCSRVLMHLASAPLLATRFVAACAGYAGGVSR
ncbi:MAG: hypothetical protein M5U22_14820 [Thermoleophilia bacterium]|nr:hypothetical protein [Thermoleophilia bacterium]